MAKKEKPLSKTNSKYWSTRVYQPKVNGRIVTGFYIRIQHDGQRHALALKATTREKAGVEARDLYLKTKANGWVDVLADYETPSGSKKLAVAQDSTPRQRGFIERPTVGDLIQAAEELLTVRRSTLESYAKALRTIVSQIFGLHPQKKYSRGKEAQRWRDRIDRVPLDSIRRSDVLAWKNKRLREHEDDPVRKRGTINTVNTAMRGAKALYGKKIRIFLEERMNLPSPMPFDGVPLEKPPSLRYQSKINAAKLLKKAKKKLAKKRQEQFKIFLLALICGLRKGEIDCLRWEAFDFKKGVLRIQHTESHELKSEDSAGEIDLDEETITLFRGFYQQRRGPFVIEWKSERTPGQRQTRSYRCDWLFNQLYQRLKKWGVDSKHPLHELRKEVGSIIANEQGIFEASRYLRHSDIRITSQYYVDKKKRITPGLGILLNDKRPSPSEAGDIKKSA